jgi:hypothetical protein
MCLVGKLRLNPRSFPSQTLRVDPQADTPSAFSILPPLDRLFAAPLPAVAALRASLALVAVFFTLGFVYFMNGIGSFVHHDNLAVAAGVFGFLNALAAFYAAFSGLLTNETSYFLLPVGDRRPAAVRHGAYHE